ncbi:hypothetical protein MIR68_011861 [Amoeboaphelidium protococcarum]|nr:hypothetical protein MIR68_011861 [Amoeboaphelidium protococcarum]
MGGGHDGSHWAEPAGPRYRYPKWVWSSTGGWWADPKYWRSNTAKVMLGFILPASLTAFYVSSQREQHSKPPTSWSPALIYAKEFQPGGQWHTEAQSLRK